jgi:hypothetical protein
MAAIAGGSEPVEQSGTLAPDTRPLTGAETLSLGMPAQAHNYWQPHFDVVEMGESDALNGNSQQPSWTSFSNLLLGIDAHATSGRNDFAFSYTGGGTISNDGTNEDSTDQNLGMTDRYNWRRISLTLIEQATILPESSVGFGGGAGLGGTANIGIQDTLLPGQTALTQRGARLTDASIGQINANVTARSSFTFVGGYSLLHYFQTDALDYGETFGQVGYNYQASRANTLALSYAYNRYGYQVNGAGQLIDDHVIQGSFGRRVTGRLAFQLSGGPEFVVYRSTLPGGVFGGAGTHVSGSASMVLLYQATPRTGYDVTFSHGVTGGSGVYQGANTDAVTVNFTHALTRSTFLGGNGTYAHNEALGANAPASQLGNTSSLGTAAGQFSLSHTLSQTLQLSFWYQAQYQGATSGFCIGSACQSSLIRHTVSMSVSWHARVLPIE